MAPDPHRLLRPRRRIQGMSAVLLPFDPSGGIDWKGFAAHLERTVRSGLVPAVNMDTGFVQQLDEAAKLRVLDLARSLAGAGFVAGAHVQDEAGAPYDADRYRGALAPIVERGGLPVVFPSHGLSSLDPDGWLAAHAELGGELDRFLAFELGAQFVPYGRIQPLETWRELLSIRSCVGAKHSSLSRILEWERLEVRDALRPDFLLLTGNDLAIDMVMYGSDYLLGLSTFAPDRFALRDRYWEQGDPRFHALDDLLQYLGELCFRDPVPAYRHSAAQFLCLRGQLDSDHVHPAAPRRPDSDLPLLQQILARLEAFDP